MGFLIDASDATPLDSASVLLPDGTYPAIMKNFTVETDRDGVGRRIPAQYVICDGPHKGHIIYDNAYVYDPNGKRVLHGKSIIKGISDALKISPAWQDETVLSMNGKRIDIVLGTAPASNDGKYKARNRINGFVAPNSAANNAAIAPMQTAPMLASQTAAFPSFPQQPIQAQPLAPQQNYAQPAPQPAAQPVSNGAPSFMHGALG